jgi:hypothetical protein
MTHGSMCHYTRRATATRIGEVCRKLNEPAPEPTLFRLTTISEDGAGGGPLPCLGAGAGAGALVTGGGHARPVAAGAVLALGDLPVHGRHMAAAAGPR